MYIFFYVSIIVFIVGIIFFIIGLKKERQDLMILEDKARDQIRNTCKELNDECLSLARDRDSLTIQKNSIARERQVEQERLDDIRRERDIMIQREVQHLQEQLDLNQKLKLQQLDLDYKKKSEELVAKYDMQREVLEEDLDSFKEKVKEFRSIQEAINEAIQRKKELEDHTAFYSIDVSPNDREDIAVLQSMDMKLHHRDVIPKIIWELFIRRPAQEMIKRVVGDKKSSGIYKITYVPTGEAYIGKTSDFATRWQNHLKTVIGLDGAARATLHNRMAKDGLWNYTFEIVERVDKDQLAAREAYYIDFYGTKQQLNMKSGEKNGTQ